jgi:hypothetical protein
MKMSNYTTKIGLFGTCGNSTWRDAFIEQYNKFEVGFFNPLVKDWDPSLAEIEAWHLSNDEIILFPVTDETYGVGSLAEIGFSVLSSLKRELNKHVIIYIAPKVDESKLAAVDKQAVKDSNNARALVLAHLKANRMSNIHIVNSLYEMLELSIVLYASAELLSLVKIPNWQTGIHSSQLREIINMIDHTKESVVTRNEDIKAGVPRY